MYVILGAAGHIGRELVRDLSAKGCDVLAVTHHAPLPSQFAGSTVTSLAVDMLDVDSLRAALKRGKRAFLLNPPAAPSQDTDREEHRTMHAILDALRGAPLEKVVLASTYGAQPGDRIGDLSVLFDFEEALRRQPVPVSVLRSAYYMSNWDALLPAAREGSLPTFFPAGFSLPMVAPRDIAQAAAELLLAPPEPFAIHHVEGPVHYSPTDVATAFTAALGRTVSLREIPRDRWEPTYRELGFSAEAAHAYCRMTATIVDQGPETPPSPRPGHTSLNEYIRDLAARQPPNA